MQGTSSEGGGSRNRCSFVKVGHLRATIHLRMRCECTIPRHNHAYPFSWISRCALHTETGRHSHFTLRAVTIETAQRHLSEDVVRNFLFCVQKLRVSMDTLQNNENTGAQNKWLWMPGTQNQRKIWENVKNACFIIMKNWCQPYGLNQPGSRSSYLSLGFFLFVSYLMNDLRHWQLVCIRVHRSL